MRRDEERQLPIGAELTPHGVNFRVWAPERKSVAIVSETKGNRTVFPLEQGNTGYFSGASDQFHPGDLYWIQLDDDSGLYPDPASRFQPDGPHGPSQIVDPYAFEWSDRGWRGVRLAGQVLYELHIGTFSPEGTWQGAIDRLEMLADLGVTCIEVMPVADFGGEFGWGYDGVNLFAPTRLYGKPDDFRRFVDRAHTLGMGVILDVVYNHFGPDGNYTGPFSKYYLTNRYHTDWGDAINYDGDNCKGVREFVTSNVVMWIREYHLDGFRVDATQNIYDAQHPHILQLLSITARRAAGKREVIVIAENEPQDIRIVRHVSEGGFGFDGLWNDDFHHAAFVRLCGHSEAYYTDYRGTAQEFVSLLKYGYLFQGQWYSWQKKRRGVASLDASCRHFVNYLENHDQVSNSGNGQRRHQRSHPGCYRALTALLLLGPGTPMLFQGQEFGATTPFFYFASHQPELAKLVDKGRKEFLSQFPSLATEAMQKRMVDPASRETFEHSKLDWSEREQHLESLDLHRDLIRIRRDDGVLSRQTGNLDGAVFGPDAFVIRFFGISEEELSSVEDDDFPVGCPRDDEPLYDPRDDELYFGGSSSHAGRKRRRRRRHSGGSGYLYTGEDGNFTNGGEPNAQRPEANEGTTISKQSVDSASNDSGAIWSELLNDPTTDRLLIVNLGTDLPLIPAPEPLLAEPYQCEWKTVWCSEDPKYGGSGIHSAQRSGAWYFPGYSATLLMAVGCGNKSATRPAPKRG